MPASNYSRLLSENEAEEVAQFNLFIRESLRDNSTVSTSTATTRALLSTEPTQSVESLPNDSDINIDETLQTDKDKKTAELLLSLSRMNCVIRPLFFR